jgi:hypothetical protein
MEWISRVILHIENYFLLSNFSKSMISWTLFGIILFALFSIFSKKIQDQKISLYVGFAIRVVLLIGLSIEMLHQVRLTELTTIYQDRNQSIRQFLYFLFYGYVLVVGFYYIVTIDRKEKKGLFYIFDIAVLVLPVLQLITSFFYYIGENSTIGLLEVLFISVLIGYIAALLLLFFKNYWNRRVPSILLFYVLVLMPIVPLISQSGVNFRMQHVMELSNFAVFIGLLMTYHLLVTSNKSIIQKSNIGIKLFTVIIFLVLSNPIYSLIDLALASTEAEVKLRFYEDTDLVTLDEAKQLAHKITGEKDFFFNHRPHEDFHNVYRLTSDRYTIDIDGISGMVKNLNLKDSPEGEILENEEYIKRSLDLLNQMGRELLAENQIQITTSKSKDKVTVQIAPKYSDGTMIKERPVETTFTWKKESLTEFHERQSIYIVESLRNTKITNEDVHEILIDWYDAIGLEMPSFSIKGIQHGYSNRRVELFIETKSQDQLIVNGFTGEVISFSTELDREEELAKMEDKILKLKGINDKKWDRTRIDSSWVWSEKEPDHTTLPYQHSFGYYKGSTFFRYHKRIDYLHHSRSNTNNAASREALHAVLNQLSYPPYATRTKFTNVVDQNDQIRKAWLVVVQPFGSTEHKLYLVDLETKKVDALYE